MVLKVVINAFKFICNYESFNTYCTNQIGWFFFLWISTQDVKINCVLIFYLATFDNLKTTMQVNIKNTNILIIFWQINFINHYKLFSQKAERNARKSHNMRNRKTVCTTIFRRYNCFGWYTFLQNIVLKIGVFFSIEKETKKFNRKKYI